MKQDQALFNEVIIRLPPDVPMKEPEVFRGVVVSMKMDYETYSAVGEHLRSICAEYGIQIDIA